MGYGMDVEDWGEAADDEIREDELAREAEAMLTRYMKPTSKSSVIQCVACTKTLRRRHPSQRFCSRPCKDRFHNITNPQRLERAREICRS